MAVTWTADQRKVIEARDVNLLVSAAAGSGKTAVLVERILSLVTDPKKPADIDRLLVVTFTNAAAAEMRERLRSALERRAGEEPGNAHLQRQLVLVHNARIMTIHSFCLEVLRNHFQEAKLDPSFRVADEGEIRLLEQDIARETVDGAYEKKDERFSRFLERFTPGKNDKILEETLIRIYHFSQGQPWPEAWLKECCAAYERESGMPWLSELLEKTKRTLEDYRKQLWYARTLVRGPDGPAAYESALEKDMEILNRIAAGLDSYQTLGKAFAALPPFSPAGAGTG